MHPKFTVISDQLHSSFETLVKCEPHSGPNRLSVDVLRCAVYLFSEDEGHLYVGRTDRLRDRHKEHWSGRQNDAPFAFKLARHATNNFKRKGAMTRAQLMIDEPFKAAFVDAKKRVAAMKFRWVEVVDPNHQCLLEIYATIALDAKYNDFINH